MDDYEDAINDAAVKYVQLLSIAYPELINWCIELSDFYQLKKWHNLSNTIEDFIRIPIFPGGEVLVLLYQNFIIHFETKINLLKLAYIVDRVCQRYPEEEAAISFLEGVIGRIQATKQKCIEEPIMFLNITLALLYLEKGDQIECKNLLDNAKNSLDSMTDIHQSIYSQYYWVLSQYHKSRREFAEFYKSLFLYVPFDPVEPVSNPFKQGQEKNMNVDLAVDMSLSALLGDNIYNFGELLVHPTIKSLQDSPVSWLYHLLEAFNSGDLVRFRDLCLVHREFLSAQPALVENEKKILEKCHILCLMDIIYSRLSEDRTISLSLIAKRTKLSVEDAEYLLMKSLSVHLIEGIIDQVDGTVYVSWAQPRVLGIPQIRDLRHRPDNWINKLQRAIATMEAETPDVRTYILPDESTEGIPL
ncbi:26S proteasome non-ATPase regulatory subunit 13 homolog A [Tanacetum coccineum]